MNNLFVDDHIMNVQNLILCPKRIKFLNKIKNRRSLFTLRNIHIGLTELSGPSIPQANTGVISSINVRNVVRNPS